MENTVLLYQKLSIQRLVAGIFLVHSLQGDIHSTERYEQYLNLNLVEKYMFVLETFWKDSDWYNLQTDTYSSPPIYKVSRVLDLLSKTKLGSEINIKNNSLFLKWGSFIDYFYYLGFWEVVKDDSEISSVITSDFGMEITKILNNYRNIVEWNIPCNRQLAREEADFESLGMLFGFLVNDEDESYAEEYFDIADEEPFDLPFKALFSSDTLTRSIVSQKKNQHNSSFYLKVILNKQLWSRIKISGNCTLLDLHEIILEAFGLYNNHLYAFFMDCIPWSHNSYNAPEDSIGPYVNEVKIGDLELFPGKKFIYIFDYVTELSIDIIVEKIEENNEKMFESIVLEKKGTISPK